MPIDKRRQPRYDVRLSAEFLTKARLARDRDDQERVERRRGASSSRTPRSVDDQELELSLFLVVEGVEDPSKPPLRVSAKVMWTGEGDDGSFAAGVRFEKITAEQTRWLERFLEVTAA
jgi:hypothetical protein